MAHTFNLDTYITFLTANGNRYSGVEAAKGLQGTNDAPAHDTVSRFLAEGTYTPSHLWKHVQTTVDKKSTLIIDDTVLDKRWSPTNELVNWHWSGNEHKVIRGISLVNLLATNGDDCVPVDYRVYEGSAETKNKNEHFIDMLNMAKKRGFEPSYVMADSWYSSLENLQHLRNMRWRFVMGLKENRLVNETKGAYLPIRDLDWTTKKVRKVWLRGFGFVLVAQIIFKNGDVRYVCTNDLTLTDYGALSAQSKKRWTIEEFHRGIKQTTGIECCYSVKKRSQLTHIFASFVAFVLLEFERLRTGISWYEQKARLVRLGIVAAFA